MDNIKNVSLATLSSISTVLTAIETEKMIAIISAVVLPILFFTVGKTVDVCVQVYFRRRQERLEQEKRNAIN